ncbi:hypothetical protein BD414DRAFT_486750 [Trametes punicea]|nr:hypothetical protein BD414DRAFT_486750 [Trametes punicea]
MHRAGALLVRAVIYIAIARDLMRPEPATRSTFYSRCMPWQSKDNPAYMLDADRSRYRATYCLQRRYRPRRHPDAPRVDARMLRVTGRISAFMSSRSQEWRHHGARAGRTTIHACDTPKLVPKRVKSSRGDLVEPCPDSTYDDSFRYLRRGHIPEGSGLSIQVDGAGIWIVRGRRSSVEMSFGCDKASCRGYCGSVVSRSASSAEIGKEGDVVGARVLVQTRLISKTCKRSPCRAPTANDREDQSPNTGSTEGCHRHLSM